MAWQMIVQIAAIAGMLILFAILWQRSRSEEIAADEGGSHILSVFEKMAVWIRRHRPDRQSGREPGRQQVRRSMKILYPDRHLRQHEENYYVGKLRNALVVIFLGTVLALFCVLSAIANPLITEDSAIERESYDGDDQDVSLTVRLKENENGRKRSDDYTFSVGARRYSEAQLDRMAAELGKKLSGLILGDNPSLEHVTAKLHLPSSVSGYPFQIRWESSQYALVDSDGTISTDGMKSGERQQAILTAVFLYRGSRQFEQEIPVVVEVPKQSQEEKLENDIRSALEKADQQTAQKKYFLLPTEVDGVSLSWTQKPDMAGLLVAGLSAVAAAAIWLAADEKLHRTMKNRQHQLEIDYPGILNRMVLYLGAGMSVRNVFFRLGADYRAARNRGEERRYAYDEILLVCRELESGHSEAEAYASFGSRCGLGQYSKLCTMLIRNLRKGNSVLLSVLQAEVQEATAHRMNLARELGEKAGTKMLFPMVLMLAVTMIIIIIPAYFGFSV